MKNSLKLDEEEMKVLRDFERGEFTSLTNFKQEKRQLEEAAHTQIRDGEIEKRGVTDCPQTPSPLMGEGWGEGEEENWENNPNLCHSFISFQTIFPKG